MFQNKHIFLFLCLIGTLLPSTIFDSAKFIGVKSRSNSLLQPKVYGIRQDLDISTYASMSVVMPNISVKYKIKDTDKWQVSAKTGFAYPTPLLRLLQRNGTGGIIAPDPDVGDSPHLIIIKQKFIATTTIGKTTFSPSFEVTLGFRKGQFDDRLIIDHPLVYSTLISAFRSPAYSLGFAFEKNLNSKWRLATQNNFIFINGETNKHFRNSSIISRKIGKKYSIHLGYTLSYGEYPFGDQWYLVPFIDIQKVWKK